MPESDFPLRLEYLLQATRDLRNAAEIESYLQLVAETAAELTHSEAASILVADEANGCLHFVAAPEIQLNVLKSVDVPIEGSIAGRVYLRRESEVVLNPRREPNHFRHVDDISGVETHALVAVPLIFKGRRLGVMEAINRLNGADYTEEDVAILEILAGPAAMLLYNDALEKEQNTLRAEIAGLDRMKSDFIAIASHELRTPLGLILGHATFLREIVDEQFHEQVDVIIRSGAKLKEIIEDLAKVDNFNAGMATIRSRKISIKRLIQDVVDVYQLEARNKHLSLVVDTKGNTDLLVEGDAEKIGIALGSLIKNAILFTNENGHIFVSAEQMPGYVKISVVDDGIGIPTADLTRIFERFYQVESHLTRKHGGMGLGLSVAKVMVELHGGRIWAESLIGKGSHFTILLPIDSTQVQAAEKVF